jgi:uncharacterized protein
MTVRAISGSAAAAKPAGRPKPVRPAQPSAPAASLACTRSMAVALLLHQQGLCTRPRSKAKPADVLAAIRRMHALQIDTINVIARSPYLVLFSRLGHYEQAWLDEAHARGELFEYWAHAMCWLPREDWPLYRGILADALQRCVKPYDHGQAWLQQHAQEAGWVRRELESLGPLPVSHFTKQAGPRRPDDSGEWWNWRVEKAALEFLFWTGAIVIARRDNFQRVYALREQVFPGWDDAQAMPAAAARLEQVRRAALALGVTTEPWLRDYFRHRAGTLRPLLDGLIASGELLPVELEGASAPAYLHRDLTQLLEQARTGGLKPTRTALLSPFDPVAWDRARLAGLFGFDYSISVYTPQDKRDGYFVLPVLSRGRIVARLDPKAHRKDGLFEVRSLRLEPGAELNAADWRELARELHALAAWHGTPQVKVCAGADPAAADRLSGALRELG